MTPVRPPGADALPHAVEAPRPVTRDPAAAIYAALDLGTNSCRMLIARPQGSHFEVVDSFSKTVGLGAGLESSGRLCRESMLRTVQALRICRSKLQSHGVSRMRLVATEACRRAANSRDFLRRIRAETGLALEVIPPEEEAMMAAISCAPLVSRRTEQLLVVDIGGGSTELVWLDLSDVDPADRVAAVLGLRSGLGASRQGARVVDWISVPLGVATLREQFADVEGDAARFALMSCHFEEQLSGFAPYNSAPPARDFQIIGTSGTVTTVAASFLGLRRYDRSKVDGLRMSSTQIDRVIADYLALGPEGRRSDPRIGRDRQALIMSGAAILQSLVRVWPTEMLSVADRGLREGLLYDLMTADGVLALAPQVARAGGTA